MNRTSLFFKVELDLAPDEQPQRIADEICRRVLKFYGVRKVELTNYTKLED
jgi:hypothetical protein